jgi:hypothetical protein
VHCPRATKISALIALSDNLDVMLIRRPISGDSIALKIPTITEFHAVAMVMLFQKVTVEKIHQADVEPFNFTLFRFIQILLDDEMVFVICTLDYSVTQEGLDQFVTQNSSLIGQPTDRWKRFSSLYVTIGCSTSRLLASR